MKELVVISGKGGTGKTSLTAAFAALAGQAVLADCDVDAPDLHLLLQPQVLRREEFYGGHEAVIRPETCIGCGACRAHCRFQAVRPVQTADGRPIFRIDPFACEGCGVCVRACPARAIAFPERACGERFVSETRFGPMVHARLYPGSEHSGKLASWVREEARRLAEERGLDFVLVDGPQGIGCPVMASISGASGVLAVTEPTVSGAHDLERVLALANHFRIPALVCVNKWDINPEQTAALESRAIALGARLAGRIRYDRAVTAAQLHGRSIVEGPAHPAADEVREIWKHVTERILSTTS